MKSQTFLFIVLFLSAWVGKDNCALAQVQDSLAVSRSTAHPWEEYLLELNSMEEFEGVSWEEYEDVLTEYAEHPLNINTATREDLELLPFLTPQQVEDIQAYIYQYGSMKSLAELAMLRTVNWYQQQLLRLFVYAGEKEERSFPTPRSIARYGKHEVVAYAKIPFYEREGDKNGYQGYPYKHWMRYQFHYSDKMKMGFLGSQDAGEPFFSGKNTWGYDFYTFYLQVRKWKRIKNLTVGRYRLHFGQGLILNNDFSFGKVSMLTNLGRSGNNIRVHSSRSAANYLQGAAGTVTLAKGLDMSGFLSYRKVDATVKDSAIATIVKTGLHRSPNEIEKQNAASNTLYGGNINYFNHGFHVGATAFRTSFSMPLKPNTEALYKRYAATGSSFWNASIDYGYLSHRLAFAGEVATGNSHALATLNTVSYLFSEKFSLLALYRFYSYRYYSLFSNSFSEGSDTQDENGVYIGGSWSPNRKWNIMAYTDFAYFVWPKYGTQTSTSAWDNFLQVTCKPSDGSSFTVRYHFKQKQGTDTHRGRITLGKTWPSWSLRLQGDATYVDNGEQHVGWMGTTMVRYQHTWLRCTAHFGYFHTDDYQSRLYAYESGTLYNMSIGSYYGEGIRYALLVRADVSQHVIVMGKFGVTDYFDRTTIATGLQQIAHSSMADLELQLKWKF